MKELGLSTTGKKDELVERYMSALGHAPSEGAATDAAAAAPVEETADAAQATDAAPANETAPASEDAHDNGTAEENAANDKHNKIVYSDNPTNVRHMLVKMSIHVAPTACMT